MPSSRSCCKCLDSFSALAVFFSRLGSDLIIVLCSVNVLNIVIADRNVLVRVSSLFSISGIRILDRVVTFLVVDLYFLSPEA